jgi:hypothetical protein
MARWAAIGCRMRTAIGPRVEARNSTGPSLKPRRRLNKNRSRLWQRKTRSFASAKHLVTSEKSENNEELLG